MGNKVFTCSDKFKSEYSCAVVRIDKLTPVEGSDFLAKTLIMGTQIVVRKDMVHEGMLMLYAANETQLHERFLSVNNLFEISCRDKNANADEVNAIMKPYTDTLPTIDKYRNDAKNVKSQIDGLKRKADKLKKTVKKMTKELESLNDEEAEYIAKRSAIDDANIKIDAAQKKALEKTTVYTALRQKVDEMVKAGEPVVTEAKKHCGFFNKYGRVRCITLRNEPSFGFLFALEELQRFCPRVTMKDLENYEGQEFDTVDGELFAKMFIPPVKKENERKSRTNKAQKKIRRFDRIIDGTFYFHYDTAQLAKNIKRIYPDNNVTISNKIHGTSVVISKLPVREPKKIAWYKTLINKIWVFFKKQKPFIDYNVVIGPVYSSRTVIKNKYINKEANGGYYKVDLWSMWGDIIYPYLDEGITVYGEIFGYLPGENGTYIQKFYDYGCEKGQSKLMPYRVTSTTPSGAKYEWEVTEVKEFAEELIRKMKANNDPNAELIHPIDIMYHGTLGNLYPDIDTEQHWHENVLEALKNDREHFGMEENEPMCTANTVPREGFVLRVDGDPIPSAMKLKTNSFALKEAIFYDSDDYVDIEQVAEENSDDNENEA